VLKSGTAAPAMIALTIVIVDPEMELLTRSAGHSG
jgi:hypothetical protein